MTKQVNIDVAGMNIEAHDLNDEGTTVLVTCNGVPTGTASYG